MYKNRLIQFIGAIRCVEVTYNSSNNTYHPHYHVLILSYDYDDFIFDKKYLGEWSTKKQKYNFYSDIDIQISKVWTCLYSGVKLSSIDSLENNYICDIREMDNSGVYEVLKYVFKDTDILNYYVFRDLYFGLYNKRIRQGYGCFYNVKFENESDGDKQSLLNYFEEIKELPSELVTPDMEILINRYSNYIKISRFNKHIRFNDVEQEGLFVRVVLCLKEHREFNNMTQEYVCRYLDVASSTYRNMEKNRFKKFDFIYLFKLKVLFNLSSIEDLFKVEE